MNKIKKFHIQTFGCQMNERDSETLAGILTELGYMQCTSKEEADVALINTCSVREHADERFFGTLGQLKKIKENRPDFVVCVCGCMMQQQHIIDRIKSKYSWVDIIFGTHNIHDFPKLLQGVIDENKKQVNVWPNGGEIVENLPSKRAHRYKAYVNIIFGCNNFCTYCIVPYTRGRERSRRAEDIVNEVKSLVKDGVKEITLLGQNVNSYNGGDTNFSGLLYLLNDIEGLERIRFMTSHPKDLSDDLIKAYEDCSKICSYIHLPVQSGSDRVLSRMNRRYTVADYKKVISKLRKVRTDIAVTTDIIVGFPGETEEDFEETLKLCKEVEFDSAFTFIYSIRKGTPAANYENQVPEEVKHERFNRLLKVINALSEYKNSQMKGKILKILVDGESKKNKNNLTGRSEGFKLVDFYGENKEIGDIVNVEITGTNPFSLEGKRK